jgi:MerR family transcriptional regulator, light-induced transcriptional regulator
MNMDNENQDFFDALEREDKKYCVEWAMEKLAAHQLDIFSLYAGVLTPALNMHASCENDDFSCIWKEHVRTGIVRTIIESSFLQVIKERDDLGFENNDKIVIVLCPPKETHEIGARMIADFFTIYGYDTIFVGSDTPTKSFLAAIEDYHPRYIAISTTNPYNVFHLQKTIEQIRAIKKYDDIKIIVGGSAFKDHPDLFQTVGADMQMNSEDLYELAKNDSVLTKPVN